MRPETSSDIISDQIDITSLIELQSHQEMTHEIFHGLNTHQKYIDSRFFYDELGSEIFERITRLEAYYPTRTEMGILKSKASLLVDSMDDLHIIELGSGDSTKISILLDSLPEQRINSTCYYPVDISESAILKSAAVLVEKYPGLQINGMLADFMQHLDTLPGTSPRLICFFGSTIGNLSRRQGEEFISGIKKLMAPGDSLLLGLDMVKKVELLEAAYNDNHGVTADFNKNILNSVNHLARTNFNPEHFQHISFYNQDQKRMEMYLEAKRDMVVTSPHFSIDIHISNGERIHTENSHKYAEEDIEFMAESSGLDIKDVYTDNKGWFSVVKFACPDCQ